MNTNEIVHDENDAEPNRTRHMIHLHSSKDGDQAKYFLQFKSGAFQKLCFILFKSFLIY